MISLGGPQLLSKKKHSARFNIVLLYNIPDKKLYASEQIYNNMQSEFKLSLINTNETRQDFSIDNLGNLCSFFVVDTAMRTTGKCGPRARVCGPLQSNSKPNLNPNTDSTNYRYVSFTV